MRRDCLRSMENFDNIYYNTIIFFYADYWVNLKNDVFYMHTFHAHLHINPIQPGVAYLHPLKTSENL